MPLRSIIRNCLGITLMTTIFSLPAQSADYQSMTTEELNQIRGTLYNNSQEERDAFREEWRKRLEAMETSERAKYAGSVTGNGYGLRDGSGSGRQGDVGQGLANGRGNNKGSDVGRGNRNAGNGGRGSNSNSGGGKGNGNGGNGGGKGNGNGGGKGRK